MRLRHLALSAPLRLAFAWLVALGLLLAPLPRTAPVAARAEASLQIAGIAVAICGHGEVALPGSPDAPKPAGHDCCECPLCPPAHGIVAMLPLAAPALPVPQGAVRLALAARPALPDTTRRYSPALARAPPLSALT